MSRYNACHWTKYGWQINTFALNLFSCNFSLNGFFHSSWVLQNDTSWQSIHTNRSLRSNLRRQKYFFHRDGRNKSYSKLSYQELISHNRWAWPRYFYIRWTSNRLSCLKLHRQKDQVQHHVLHSLPCALRKVLDRPKRKAKQSLSS